MDVWMKECYRDTTCSYCGRIIPKGAYVICGKKWVTKSEASATLDARKFLVRRYWHETNEEGQCCWIEQAKYYLSLRPKPVKSPAGRKRLELSESDRLARQKIVNRRSTIIQRIRTEWEKPFEIIDYDELSHLGEMLTRCREEIAPLGGVPKSWEDKQHLTGQ